jgi:hypothetical protein
MRSPTLFTAVCFAVFATFAASAMAHHSLTVEYDSSRTVTLNGTLAKVEWVNPHVWIYVDAKDPADGKTVEWRFETGSRSCMEKMGIARESFAVGSAVTVRNAVMAKTAPRVAFLDSVSDGAKTVSVLRSGLTATLELKSVFDRPPAVQPKPGGKGAELQPVPPADPLADPLALVTTLPGYRAEPMPVCG